MDKSQALKIIEESPVKVGQIWRHVKTDHTYSILALGLDEPTLSPIVIYTGDDGVVWSRLLSVFLENVDQPRFVLVTTEE